MTESVRAEIGSKLHKAQRILVTSHIRPDGDAIGSVLGLGLALQERGKAVQMVLADSVPAAFRHLEGSDQVRCSAEGEVDLVVVLDCSDLMRVGDALDGLPMPGSAAGEWLPDVNIDHHITNLNFARLNLVETNAVATTAVLADSLAGWDLPVTRPVADALLTGLVTDTLGFRTSNINPEAMRTAARLMEAGADLSSLYQTALVSRTFEAARFWGAGLSDLQRSGRLVWTTLTMDARRAAGYSGRDDADLINLLSSIEEAAVSVIFVEQLGGKVKISWRAQPGLDVSKVAMVFGGGGHRAAAGAELEGALEDVQTKVLAATEELFANGF